MKIGLFLGSMSPSEGGAYTLISDQLSALRRLRATCRHEIVLFYHQAGLALAQQFPEFASINLDAARLGVRTQDEVDRIMALREQQRLKQQEFRARRLERIKRFAGRMGRFLASFYSLEPQLNISDPPTAEELGPDPSAPHASWQGDIYRREGVQFLIFLAPWFGEIVMDIPFSVMLWDLQHRGSPWFPEVSAGNEWRRREDNYTELLRRATVIYTGTKRGREEAAFYYQIDQIRIKVLPFCAPSFASDAAGSTTGADRLRSLGVKPDFLFYPAQFWAHKNHVLVLEACKIVRDETGWDLGVVFTGADKGNQDYVREYADRLGLGQCTKILGFVDKSDILELYKGAFCLVFPTFFGPDNLPPLEAFGLGCPVIASDIPGAEEQLGTAAMLVAPTDERAWANTILSLRDPGLRAQLTDAGLAATAHGSWDDYAKLIIDSVDEFAKIRRTWR